jgi:hypothetical protein
MWSTRERDTTAKTRRMTSLFVAAALLVIPGIAAAEEVFGLRGTINIPGNPLNSFDISWVDKDNSIYLLADRSNKSVDVIDTNAQTVITQIQPGFVGFTGNNDTSGPDGVLSLNNQGQTEIWVGDGNSTVKVINYPQGTLTHTIPTGGVNRADELCYDQTHNLIMIANDADSPPFVTIIPTRGPNAYTVVKTIKIPEATNGIEQCGWSTYTGLFYLNIPEVNGPGNDTVPGAVYVIDPTTMAIVQKFPVDISRCAGPQGLALGPKPQILLGCNAASIPSGIQNTAIMDFNGNIISTLTNTGGADEVWFNPGDGHYTIAGGSHSPVQLSIVDSVNKTTDQIIKIGTGPGRAHSVAQDPVSNLVYLPVPNNGGSTLCPTANGCIAVFGPTTPNDRPVRIRRAPPK